MHVCNGEIVSVSGLGIRAGCATFPYRLPDMLGVDNFVRFSVALVLLSWRILAPFEAMSQQVKTVDSDWLELGFPAGRTLEEAEAWAVEQARIKALANAFGTLVNSETVRVQSDYNGKVDDAFTELNVSQVKGEWLETRTVEGPYRECQDGDFILRVRVTGKARSLRSDRVDLEMALRADVRAVQPVVALQDGDRLRLRFSSPVDGYVMFFYVEDGVVYALTNSKADMAASIRGQQVYSLFSTESEWIEAQAGASGLDRLARYAWGFQVTHSGAVDAGALVVGAFSRQGFAPPRMDWNETEGVSTMEESAFERWLKQQGSQSALFQVERLPFRIAAKQRY